MIIFFNCIVVCATREEKKEDWIAITVDEGYFYLFVKVKMEICQNYRGARSHYGGAGKISLFLISHYHYYFYIFLDSNAKGYKERKVRCEWSYHFFLGANPFSN